MSSPPRVLVVGATGHVGSQIVDALLKRGDQVRVKALVRPSSDASKLEAKGVEVVRGDMTDLASLEAAMKDVDVVVKSAASYMSRKKGDNNQGDRDAAVNLAKAAKKTNVKRYVLIGIVASDQAIPVPHFYNAFFGETCLRDEGVPFVVLRAGAFIDQGSEMNEKSIKGNKLYGFGDRDETRIAYTYTADLAEAAAKAALAPSKDVENKVFDVVVRPGAISNAEFAGAVERATGRKLSLSIVPWWLVTGLAFVSYYVSELGYDIMVMAKWWRENKYQENPEPYERMFGPLPTLDDAVKRWVAAKGLMAQ